MAVGVARSQPREEYGVGHGLAMATDCLTLAGLYDGDERTLPVVQALAGLAEPTRSRDEWTLPSGDASIDLAQAIETEDLDGALSSVLGQLEAGDDGDDSACPGRLCPDTGGGRCWQLADQTGGRDQDHHGAAPD